MSAITKPDIKRVEEAICNPITSSEGRAIRPPPNPVIAFPKTQTASCLLTDAPGEAAQDQLEELHIRFHGLDKEV